MTNHLGTARHLPTTEPHSLHAHEVRSMRRGLRWLAVRGTTARPAAWRSASSPNVVAASPS
jgi:hypothetical protein